MYALSQMLGANNFAICLDNDTLLYRDKVLLVESLDKDDFILDGYFVDKRKFLTKPELKEKGKTTAREREDTESEDEDEKDEEEIIPLQQNIAHEGSDFIHNDTGTDCFNDASEELTPLH